MLHFEFFRFTSFPFNREIGLACPYFRVYFFLYQTYFLLLFTNTLPCRLLMTQLFLYSLHLFVCFSINIFWLFFSKISLVKNPSFTHQYLSRFDKVPEIIILLCLLNRDYYRFSIAVYRLLISVSLTLILFCLCRSLVARFGAEI